MLTPCPECRVPEYIYREHLWLDNGDIVQAREQRHRMAFIDCENIDPIFHAIEQAIGESIEPLVMACVRINVRSYLNLFMPPELRDVILSQSIDYKPIDDNFRNLAKSMGYGRYDFVDLRFEKGHGDYCAVCLTEPFSLPMAVASHVAAVEAILNVEHNAVYTELEPHVYDITAFPREHDRELPKKLALEYYSHEDGDMDLERCPSCQSPMALSGYKWYIDRGIILNEFTRRRMAMISPQELDPVFKVLEDEHGEAVPRAVIEASRRFTRTGFYSMEDIANEGDFRTQLAGRGLGNLRDFAVSRSGFRMRLANAVLPLIIVGIVQGMFEMAFDVNSNAEWEFTEDRLLKVDVTPQSTKKAPSFSPLL